MLPGSTVLITGSSQGLGFEIAKILDKQGMRVILTGRNSDRLNYALAQLSSTIKHVAIPGDLTDSNHINTLVNKLKDQNIYPTIIIHNLGYSLSEDKFPLKPEVLRDAIRIHLEVALMLNEAFLPIMIKNNFGRIIHISSDSSKTGKCSPAYAAAKSAVNGYVKSAARYYAKYNIMFCAVLPNVFEHENSVWSRKKETHPERYHERLSQMPAGRFPQTSEVAKYVADIAYNESIMSAGSLFELTGGY